MRTVSYRLADLSRATIRIGRVGENDYTRVVFDSRTVFDEYPGAIPALTIAPPMGQPYPAVATREGDLVIWDVTDSDLASSGMGEAQLTFTENGVVCKSCIAKLVVERSITASGEAPDPIEDWLTAANTALNAIPQTIDDALAEAKASGEFDGEDGVSPVVNITTITGGHRITITDAEGTHAFDVMDGEDGDTGNGIASISKTGTSGLVDTYTITYTNGNTTTFTVTNGEKGDPGDPGDPGQPGYSPIATVSKSGKTVTITITDKNGTTTETVSDGDDADPTTLIDDTSTAQNKVWSAKKSDSEVDSLKSAISGLTVEETLLRDELPGTSTTVTLDSNGNPTSIVHSASGTTVRTDTFVWSTGSVTETRTTSEYYIIITTNMATLAQTISDISEVA